MNRAFLYRLFLCPQARLVEMVAGHLLDSNQVEGARGAALSEEQRASLAHTLAEAISLLPQLCTGIDVNVRLHDVAGFEYTRETVRARSGGAMHGGAVGLLAGQCRSQPAGAAGRRLHTAPTPPPPCPCTTPPHQAVFDLLDIPLVHGWVVDPQVPAVPAG